MKIRTGFVANSSSSSFVLDKSKITDDQLKAVLNHISYTREHFNVQEDYPAPYLEDGFWCGDMDWWILDNSGEPFLGGYTYMDNFDMGRFFEKIGIVKDTYSFD